MSKVKIKANGKIILPYFKTAPVSNETHILKFATEGSACFDLEFRPEGHTSYVGYDKTNAPFERFFTKDNTMVITVMPGDRVMVPTGIIFDIPENFSIRVHPRSGISLKQGLTIINCEGIIDSDYVEETFLLIVNHSEVKAIIEPGTRLAQAELIPVIPDIQFEIMENKPEKKTARVGGMGSTGIN